MQRFDGRLGQVALVSVVFPLCTFLYKRREAYFLILYVIFEVNYMKTQWHTD